MDVTDSPSYNAFALSDRTLFYKSVELTQKSCSLYKGLKLLNLDEKNIGISVMDRHF